MYAGEDIPLSIVADRETTLRLCTLAVREVWPDAVMQDAQTAEVFTSLAKVPFRRMVQLMIYRNEAARRSWDDLGADESNRNSMIHLLFTANGFTAVLDDTVSEESRALLSAIRSILDANRDQFFRINPPPVRGEAA